MPDLFPPEILDSHIAILGKTGSGKSNVAKVMAEKLMHNGERVCVIDPTGFGNILGSLRTLGLIDYPARGVVGLQSWVHELL